MLEQLLKRRPYNAVTDFVDAPVARGLGGAPAPDHGSTAPIDVRSDLPRTATGKLQRFKLRELEISL